MHPVGGSRDQGRASDPNWYVLVAGLPLPAAPITLAPGISLVPLPGPLSIFDLAAVGAAGFREWGLVGQVAPSCTCEIESAKDSDVTPGYDTLNRAWLVCAMLVLRGYGSVMPVACSSYPWSSIGDTAKRRSDWFLQALRNRGLSETHPSGESLRPFHGGLLDFHARMIMLDSFRRDAIEPEDAEWCQVSYKQFNELCAASPAFRFALEAAMDWRYAKDLRTATSRLWAGIESLFGVNSELVFRIAAYGAALLAPRGPSRTREYAHIKSLYSIRSKAVHGEAINNNKLLQGLADSFELIRRLLQAMVDRGGVPTRAEYDEILLER